MNNPSSVIDIFVSENNRLILIYLFRPIKKKEKKCTRFFSIKNTYPLKWQSLRTTEQIRNIN